MNITIFGATGDLGSQCLKQSIAAGHDVTVLVRSPGKLPSELASKVNIIQGDALVAEDVAAALPTGTDVVLFAIGVDEKTSPLNLCTDVTVHVLNAMRSNNINRLIWCAGGSNLMPEDQITFGAKFVRWYSEVFLKHRHTDKVHQQELLDNNKDINWLGIRPLQMKHGNTTGQYRLGYDKFSGMSKISFGDCAHAMMTMLEDDTWLHKAPIVQY